MWKTPEGTGVNEEAPFKVRWTHSDALADAPSDVKATGTSARDGFRIAVKPAEYSWRQLAGAGALAGIGFTMSLFIAGEAFPAAADFAAAKIAIFIASIAAGILGTAILWKKRSSHDATEESAMDDREVAATKT